MTDASWRFVNAIAPTTATVLDLHNGSPFWVAEWAAPPPELRRSTSTTMLADGSVETASAFDDRVLSLRLDMQSATADAVAVSFQELARILLAPQWLRYQPPSTSRPVFFRTKPCAPAEIEEYRLLAERNKEIRLEIPADPFAYGLPVSGTATVPNDPTDTGMRFVIGSVKGDVPAPLKMVCGLGSGSQPSGTKLVASSTSPGFLHAPVFWTNEFAPPLTTVSDATAIGGQYSRLTVQSSTAAEWVQVAVNSVPAGEYRVLVRASAPDGGSLVAFSSPDLADAVNVDAPKVNLSTSWAWMDMGVMRLPHNARQGNVWEPAGSGTATVNFLCYAAAGQTIRLDHLVLIPAPGADGSHGRLLTFSMIRRANLQFTVSPNTESVWTTDPTYGYNVSCAVAGGGFPEVVPGETNVISFVRALGSPSGAFVPADNKAAVTSIFWTYHPRYLYLRGD